MKNTFKKMLMVMVAISMVCQPVFADEIDEINVTAEPTPAPVETVMPQETDNTEDPEETETPEETEQPEETEEPAETEQPEVTEEPTETEQPEETEEPTETEQPEVTEEPTETEQPEVTEEPVETEQPEATEEPIETVQPEATEEAPVAFAGSVEIELENEGDIYYGDTVVLRAKMTGANTSYTIHWEVWDEIEEEWIVIEGENEETYEFVVTEENAACEYRVVLTTEA